MPAAPEPMRKEHENSLLNGSRITPAGDAVVAGRSQVDGPLDSPGF